MHRRDFLMTSGLLAGFGGLPNIINGQSPIANGINDPLKPILLPTQPPLDHKGGMDIRIWMRTGMTNGLFSSVECVVAPKIMGPPPHLHKALDELMYVIEGTASVLVGDDVVEIQAGGWHLRPRLIQHTFWNASEQPLRFIDMYFNQPFEEFLEKIFLELTPEKGYPQGSPQLKAAHDALNEQFGLVYNSDCMEKRREIQEKYGLK